MLHNILLSFMRRFQSVFKGSYKYYFSSSLLSSFSTFFHVYPSFLPCFHLFYRFFRVCFYHLEIIRLYTFLSFLFLSFSFSFLSFLFFSFLFLSFSFLSFLLLPSFLFFLLFYFSTLPPSKPIFFSTHPSSFSAATRS